VTVELELAHVNGRSRAGRLGGVHRAKYLVSFAHVVGAGEELKDHRRSLGLVEEQLDAGGWDVGRRSVGFLDPTHELLDSLAAGISKADYTNVHVRSSFGFRWGLKIQVGD
jgi:hypothetical protein